MVLKMEELKNATRTLKKNSTLGPDGILNEVQQCLAKCKPKLLLNTYNKCLTEGNFPEIWKKKRLVLLKKGINPLNDSSPNRPLCMLDCTGKLFEKILDNRLRSFLEDNNR